MIQRNTKAGNPMPNANQIISLTSRQQGGARAKRVGQSFEEIISWSVHDFEGEVCRLDRIKNFAKRVGGDRIVEEKSPYDFTGCVSIHGMQGRGIFIDAKSCGEKIYSLRVNDEKIVKPHQIYALCRLHEAGAIAGFLVRCEREKDYRWLNPHHAKSRTPIKWDDPCWFVLGPIEGPYVPLRRLVEAFR